MTAAPEIETWAREQGYIECRGPDPDFDDTCPPDGCGWVDHDDNPVDIGKLYRDANPIRSATEWAKENGDAYHYAVAMDNHSPTRSFEYGTLYEYDIPNDHREGIVIPGGFVYFECAKKGTDLVFLIDDGKVVRPFYVAGWREPKSDTDEDEESHYLLLSKFPTNFDADGNPIMRADDDRPVDFGMWQLGPRRCHHVKIRPVPRPFKVGDGVRSDSELAEASEWTVVSVDSHLVTVRSDAGEQKTIPGRYLALVTAAS